MPIANTIERDTRCPLHVIYVNALPCKMQMLQVVTLRGDYQYQIAHLCNINSTKDTMGFNNFRVLNILR